MKKAVVIYLSYLLSISSHAYANSYLDMITQPPEEQISDENVPPQFISLQISEEYTSPATTNNQTTSPVVSPMQEQEKYQAWLKSRQNIKNMPILSKDDLQNFIYTFEAGLLGVGLYEIYRYK